MKKGKLFAVETTIAAADLRSFTLTEKDMKAAVNKADRITKGIDANAEVTLVKLLPSSLVEE